MTYRIVVGLVLVSAAIGCKEDVDSTDVRTSGVYADFEAVSNGDGTSVTAQLKVGGSNSNTYLDLKGDDVLIATVGAEENELSGSNETYRASFSEGAGDTRIEIAFMRGPDDEDAPNSVATLPEPFTLEGIDIGQEISRQDDLVIGWDPSGLDDHMEWDLDGDCIDLEFDNDISDIGMLTIRAGDVTPAFEDDATRSCEVTFTLDRVRTGNVDNAFGEGGRFLAIQRRRISFMSTP